MAGSPLPICFVLTITIPIPASIWNLNCLHAFSLLLPPLQKHDSVWDISDKQFELIVDNKPLSLMLNGEAFYDRFENFDVICGIINQLHQFFSMRWTPRCVVLPICVWQRRDCNKLADALANEAVRREGNFNLQDPNFRAMLCAKTNFVSCRTDGSYKSVSGYGAAAFAISVLKNDSPAPPCVPSFTVVPTFSDVVSQHFRRKPFPYITFCVPLSQQFNNSGSRPSADEGRTATFVLISRWIFVQALSHFIFKFSKLSSSELNNKKCLPFQNVLSISSICFFTIYKYIYIYVYIHIYICIYIYIYIYVQSAGQEATYRFLYVSVYPLPNVIVTLEQIVSTEVT